MAISQNGWPVLMSSLHARKWIIPTTGRHLILHPGSAGLVLVHLAYWFHERIEPLSGGAWDDWGYALRPIRGQTSGFSNHASGTAMDLNAQVHPLGRRNTFSEDQAERIRERLAGRYEDCVRWGGDFHHRADEMHFEIVGGAGVVVALADRLRDSVRGRRVGSDNG